MSDRLLDDRNPLSADLGDIEYLTYPASSEDDDEWEQFERKVDLVFKVFQEMLSPEALLMKRAAKDILARSGRFVAVHSNSHPILGFVGGRLSMLARGFDVLGDNVFETDARHYSGSLSAYLSCEPGQALQVRAIADRSLAGERSDVESFWGKKPDPLPVAERLFLVDWRVFFRPEQFEHLHRLLLIETEKNYKVRLGVGGATSSSMHVLGDSAIGEHLLLVEPDLIGGYMKDPPGNILRVEKNKQLYQDGERQYLNIRNRTLEVQCDMSVAMLRRAWLELNRIGRWDPEWGEPDTRSNAYFDNYDQHIRCWIPDYDNLIKHCAILTQAAISQRMREVKHPMKICEIGYGTGELSERLLLWIDNSNAPVEAFHRPPIVSTFLGIDSARRMQEFAGKRFSGRNSSQVFFDVCTAPTWCGSVKGHAPFDVICGSLVLHDIVAGNDEEKTVEVLGKLANIMSESGIMIFADVFFSDEMSEKARQLEKWKKYMRLTGLSAEEIECFFRCNPELIDTLTATKINKVKEMAGFSQMELSEIPGSESLPLRVLVLQKQQAS